MIQIDGAAIIADVKSNWLYFALLAAIPIALAMYRDEHAFLQYVPLLLCVGLMLRFAARGWIARKR